MILHNGLSESTIYIWLQNFPITFAFAFCINFFLVGPNAKKVALILSRGNKEKLNLYIPLCMVISMVIIMGTYGTIMSGLTDHIISDYFTNLGMSFIVALPLQLFIVGPFVKFVFEKIMSLKKYKEA